MNYRWHSQSIVILMLLASLANSSKTKEVKQKEEEENKRKYEHKQMFTYITCRNNGRKEEVHRCRSQHKPLYLTYMNLSLNYTYKEIKIT